MSQAHQGAAPASRLVGTPPLGPASSFGVAVSQGPGVPLPAPRGRAGIQQSLAWLAAALLVHLQSLGPGWGAGRHPRAVCEQRRPRGPGPGQGEARRRPAEGSRAKSRGQRLAPLLWQPACLLRSSPPGPPQPGPAGGQVPPPPLWMGRRVRLLQVRGVRSRLLPAPHGAGYSPGRVGGAVVSSWDVSAKVQGPS